MSQPSITSASRVVTHTGRRRRFWLAGTGIAVLAAAALVNPGSASASAYMQVIPTTPTGTVTYQRMPATVANKTGVNGVIAYDTTTDAGGLQHTHVAGPVKYVVKPPVGGPHNGTWMNAGVYTKPIPSERAVHNLEHGAVWITYRPNLPAAQVRALTSFVTARWMLSEGLIGPGGTAQANRFIDLSPWVDNTLPAPIVISSWGYQLYLSSPTDPRLLQFVKVFRRNSTYSPEYTEPVDGIPVHIGGQPATDGSQAGNPP